MTRPRPDAQRGFTLLEVLIALTISTIVIGGGVALMLSQQRMYKNSAGERGVQEMARVTLSEMAATIATAGFGVDPPVAIDLGPTVVRMGSVAEAGVDAAVKTISHACPGGPILCRDSTSRPDEIVFYARNPKFRHDLLAISGTSGITISGPLNTPLYPGQVLQVMSLSGLRWAYVTVDRFVPASSTPDPIDVALRPAAGDPLDFPMQNAALAGVANAVSRAAGAVTKVDRYRYFIGNYKDDGSEGGWEEAGVRPFLMLDQGLENAAGQTIVTAVAPDVEDLQVAYLFPNGGAQLVGATPLLPIANGDTGVDLAAPSPGYDYPTPITTTLRTNQHPGNIRGVRVAIVVRTRVSELSSADTTTATVPASLNRDVQPGEAGYRRVRFETTIALPNMDCRYPYFPVVSSGGDNLNVGGG